MPSAFRLVHVGKRTPSLPKRPFGTGPGPTWNRQPGPWSVMPCSFFLGSYYWPVPFSLCSASPPWATAASSSEFLSPCISGHTSLFWESYCWIWDARWPPTRSGGSSPMPSCLQALDLGRRKQRWTLYGWAMLATFLYGVLNNVILGRPLASVSSEAMVLLCAAGTARLICAYFFDFSHIRPAVSAGVSMESERRLGGDASPANATSRVSLGAKKRTLIYGAGDAGITLLREINQNPALRYKIIGFIDDDPAKFGSFIYRVKVFGNGAALPSIVTDRKSTRLNSSHRCI